MCVNECIWGQVKQWVYRCLKGTHHTLKIPGDVTAAGKTAKFSYIMGKMLWWPFSFLSHSSPQTGIRVISITYHSPPHLSLYSLSLLRVPLTLQKSLKIKPYFWRTWLLDISSFHQRPTPKQFHIFPGCQFPNRCPPSSLITLKFYIYTPCPKTLMAYFFLLCLLQSQKGQKLEDLYYNRCLW